LNLDACLNRLQDTDVATAIRESGQLFPWIEAAHVLGLTLVLGSIALLDLRLLGWAFQDRPVRLVVTDVLPCTWAAFGLAVVTGALLFSSNALSYAHNTFFRTKVLVLVLLGCNALVFSLVTAPGIDAWDSARRPPPRARVSAALSLALWVAVAICGRWIGFTRLSSP
jgi:hypothetical protein